MSKIILENPQPITPQMILQYVMNLQYEFAAVTSILIDEVYKVNSPADFEREFKNDFDTIANELKTDPRALMDPEKLKDIPERTKKLFILINTAQRLSPPKSDIQIIN